MPRKTGDHPGPNRYPARGSVPKVDVARLLGASRNQNLPSSRSRAASFRRRRVLSRFRRSSGLPRATPRSPRDRVRRAPIAPHGIARDVPLARQVLVLLGATAPRSSSVRQYPREAVDGHHHEPGVQPVGRGVRGRSDGRGGDSTGSSNTGPSSSAGSPTACATRSCRKGGCSKKVRRADAQTAQIPMTILLKGY